MLYKIQNKNIYSHHYSKQLLIKVKIDQKYVGIYAHYIIGTVTIYLDLQERIIVLYETIV